MPNTHYLTPVEFANAMRVSRATVSRWIQRGQLRAIKLGSARSSPLRIPASELARAGAEGLQ